MSIEPISIMFIVSAFIAITIHEFAHAITADMQGDSTPRIMGRVTLNPLKHFDPFGAIMIVFTSLSGFGIGWGKPVMVNHRNLKNPRWDSMWVALAGPLSNFLQAAIAAVIFRLIGFQNIDPFAFSAGSFIFIYILANISLMLFNLIPLGPLDGHWILGAFLPDGTRERWFLWNRFTGTFALLGIIIMAQVSKLDLLSILLEKPSYAIISFLLGR
ncbi:MAG: site-2 protease family protein [Chthonomonas sp.]|nr:site-2 protease family protein [Chthonomonas sp.]